MGFGRRGYLLESQPHSSTYDYGGNSGERSEENESGGGRSVGVGGERWWWHYMYEGWRWWHCWQCKRGMKVVVG